MKNLKNFKKNLKWLSYFYFVGLLNLIAMESLPNPFNDNQTIFNPFNDNQTILENPKIEQQLCESSKLILNLEEIFSNKFFDVFKIHEDETYKGKTVMKLNKDFDIKHYEDKDMVVLEVFNPMILQGANVAYSFVTIDKNARVSFNAQEVAPDFQSKNNLKDNVLGEILVYSSHKDLPLIPIKLPVEIKNVPSYMLLTCSGNVLMAFIRENVKQILKDNENNNELSMANKLDNNIVIKNQSKEEQKQLVVPRREERHFTQVFRRR